jgi:hypothetical protein
MADIANIQAGARGASREERNEAADSAILLLAAASLLAILLAVAVIHPSGVKDGAEYFPTMFGF